MPFFISASLFPSIMLKKLKSKYNVIINIEKTQIVENVLEIATFV